MSAITPHYRNVQQLPQRQSFWIATISASTSGRGKTLMDCRRTCRHQKKAHYAKQNFCAARLDASAYQHQPQFQQFGEAHQLPCKPFQGFIKAEQLARRELVAASVEMVWSPQRLQEAAV